MGGRRRLLGLTCALLGVLAAGSPARAALSPVAGSPFGSLPAQAGAVDFAIADLDGAAPHDAAAFTGGSGNFFVSFQHGLSSGGFEAFRAPQQGSTPGGIVAGRFHDNAATSDIVVTYRGDGHNFIRMSNGNADTADLGFELPGAGKRMVATDLTRDGRTDLAAIVELNVGGFAVAVYSGDGHGILSARAVSPVSAGTLPLRDIAAGDINDDGRADLILTASDGTTGALTVLRTSPSSLSWETTPVTTPVSAATTNLQLTDMNADGRPDAVVGAPGDNTVSVLLSNPDGTFTAAPGSPVTVPGSGGSEMALLAADLDGDGAPDVATAGNGATALTLLRNAGDGSLAPLSSTTMAGFDTVSLAADDRLGSVRPEIVALDQHSVAGTPATGAPRWEVFLNTFAPAGVAVGATEVNLTAVVGEHEDAVLSVRNDGDGGAPLEAKVTPAGAWTLVDDHDCLARPLGPGATCQFTARFTPTHSGDDDATARLTFGDAAGPVNFALHGKGLSRGTPALTAAPASVDVGQVALGANGKADVTISNTGGASATIGAPAISGPGAAAWTATSNCGGQLVEGTSCTVHLTFTPTQVGASTATLDVQAGELSQSVPLRGTAIAAELLVRPGVASFGTTLASFGSHYVIVTLTGSQQPVTVTGATITGPDARYFLLVDDYKANPNSFLSQATILSPCPKFPFTLNPGQVCRRYVRLATYDVKSPWKLDAPLSATLTFLGTMAKGTASPAVALGGRLHEAENPCDYPNCVWAPFDFKVINPEDAGTTATTTFPKLNLTKTFKAGAILDATEQPAQITAAAGSATLEGASFRVVKSGKRGKTRAVAAATAPRTDLEVVTRKRCSGNAVLAKGKLTVKPVKRGQFVLHTRSGVLVTAGKAASWTATERCRGTEIRVIRGSVRVGKRTVKAGRSVTVRRR